MCRFALYLGPPIRLAALLTRPERSLVQQARNSLESTERVNADGWGVAWYVPHLAHVPALYKSITPAWRSRALFTIARAMRSRCILAHVRSATHGLSVSRENCHPFVWRGLTFMHNGAIEDFESLRPLMVELLSPRARELVQGTTDSELLFARLTDHWLASVATTPLERLTDATRRTLIELSALRRRHAVTQPAFLNFAVSDGDCAVVSRATSGPGPASRSLYYRTGERPAREQDRTEPFVVVASEPLELTDAWKPVPGGSLVLVDEDRQVRIEPVRAPGTDLRVA